MMPRVDGFEVLRSVRSHADTRDIPVVVVTAKELTEDDRRRLGDAAQAVFLKHAMQLDDLLAEIRRSLAHHRVTRDNGGASS
jgi:CheY-like chemotaxis protein